jgi:hypothetical protein
MALTWQASARGHFSETVIQAGSSLSVYLRNGSYNGYLITPVYIAVRNGASAKPVTVNFSDGSSAVIQPYSNQAFEVGGIDSCTLTNEGASPINFYVMDSGHAKAYLDQYNTQSWQASPPTNLFLLHFSEDPVRNYGFAVNPSVTLLPQSAIDTTDTPFSTGGSCIDNGNVALANDGGVALSTDQGFLLGAASTIDFWIKRSALAVAGTSPLIGLYSAAVGSTVLGYVHSTRALTLNGVGIGNLPNDFNWHHLAISTFSANSRLFIDGTLLGTVAINASWNDGVEVVEIGNDVSAKFAEVRIRESVVWTRNFTPPTAPYSD